MHPLAAVAPQFVEMAHGIVWCVAATVDASGAPRTRVLHPVWEWDEAADQLTGWIATAPQSPKARDLDGTPSLSLTYWAPTHDTCTADCDVTWDDTAELRRAGWERFRTAPAPLGYDPSIIPEWDTPDSEAFGVIRLSPRRLRVMPGTVMTAGAGDLLTWRR
jgi:hypothetical protein